MPIRRVMRSATSRTEQPRAAMATAASPAAPESPLSAAPVLYSSEFLDSGASAAPLAGASSLSELQLAAPNAGVGNLHLTQV